LRFRDLLGLALSALFQQKLRTLLTTLGVVFGTFVLVASLSVRCGVEDTIVREYSRFGELRQIQVIPGRARVGKGDPPPWPEVRGTMSEERRQRLRAELRRHALREEEIAATPIRLTRERVAELAALPHVRAVDTWLTQGVRVRHGDRVEHALVMAPHEEEVLRRRLIAGTYLPADGRSALISEYLAYLLGFEDDDALARLPGTRLRLEHRTGGETPRLLLSLFRGEGKLPKAGEESVLDNLLRVLPDAVDKLPLTDKDKAELRRMLQPARPAEEVVLAEAVTVCGVLRIADDTEAKGQQGWVQRSVDIFVPAKTAEEMFFRQPRNREHGYDSVFVEVDSLDNVKEVNRAIEAMRLRTHAWAEQIEREQFTYRLILSAMAVIALVALLVASLGICNTMLMGVLERVREIGVMKAVGARDGHIQLIFLVEGALVGLVGGLLGLLLGWAVSFPLDAWVRAKVESGLSIKLESSVFAFPWGLLVGAPLFACLTTTLAAFYPARRAARVDPVKALRHD
jgi:putative ABC transport system permease protein